MSSTKITPHDKRLFRLFRFLHPGAELQVTPRGAVEFIYRHDQMGWQGEYACSLKHDFLDEVLRAICKEYEEEGDYCISAYAEELFFIMEKDESTKVYHREAPELFLATPEHKAKALCNLIKRSKDWRHLNKVARP